MGFLKKKGSETFRKGKSKITQKEVPKAFGIEITQKTVPKLKAAVKAHGNESRIGAFTWIGYRIRDKNYAESGAKISDEPKITRKTVPKS